MLVTDLAAYVFCLSAMVVTILQLGLILGAPWGELAMGGKFPGRFPPRLRISAAVQLALVVMSALVVLARAGILQPEGFVFPGMAIWLVVGLFFVSAILNLLTSSRKERMLGAPTTITMFVSSLTLALSE